jgi:hypothetical protein
MRPKISKRVPAMMGIQSPTGSHLPTLFQAVKQAGSGAVVIEHGAGLYSTPLLARLGCQVVCHEPHPGWNEWARWIYEGRCEFVETFADLVARVGDASVAFIDGAALERGQLLSAAIAARVAAIVVHNTEEGDWGAYGLKAEHFAAPGYEVTHHAEDSYRTTLWRR